MTPAVQRSPEWFEARLGMVTASRVADIVARTKSGYGASRANYLAQLTAERLTGSPVDGFTSPAMQWGIDHEAEARAAYQFLSDYEVSEGGFVLHPSITMAGATPDGLVEDEGLVEIKCPNTATHIETLLSGRIPAKYETQIAWQLACTCRAWCDFVSYDPRMPAQMGLFVQRVHREDHKIAELEEEVRIFLAELDRTVDRLLASFPAAEGEV